ncbi:MAG: hypothetical protein K1X88_32745 [Nannocystaceae bacterium]|nr:hypothetical protein [Nannocystaceae bacterium]
MSVVSVDAVGSVLVVACVESADESVAECVVGPAPLELSPPAEPLEDASAVVVADEPSPVESSAVLVLAAEVSSPGHALRQASVSADAPTRPMTRTQTRAESGM